MLNLVHALICYFNPEDSGLFYYASNGGLCTVSYTDVLIRLP